MTVDLLQCGAVKPLISLCRYGLYLSILLYFYGTLFPFQFDFIQNSWHAFGLTPFWDVERGRIHSLTDIMSNVLLTIPLGFFGSIWFGRNGKKQRIGKWFLIGFLLGLLVELIQLNIPSRTSDITDALNNGIGSLVGAAIALLYGRKILNFLSGSLTEKKITSYWMLAAIIAIGLLLPFDLGLNVSHVKSSLKNLWLNPWESGIPIQDGWVQMVEFAILGALATSMRKPKIVLLTLALPLFFEPMQLLVESHAPSLRDFALNFTGAALGAATARIYPSIIRPATGFVLMTLALLAQGLSPFHFTDPSHFEWIPLVEYYNQTTGAALYDAMTGLLSYGLLAFLWPRKLTILFVIVLAGSIEAAQIFIPTRSAGTTDILIAGLGAWAAYSLFRAMESLPSANAFP
jgi:glycopeptide antibiotics resistance protein